MTPTLIFDLDGTLVDTAPDLLGAANAVLAARDRPAIDPDALHHMIGFGARSLIAQAFALNPALYDLAEPATLICRCEAVTRADCQPYREWRDAKLQTRCGMGACQGRLCGPITQRLFGWTPASIRPPLVPVPARYLATAQTPPVPESGRSDTAPPARR